MRFKSDYGKYHTTGLTFVGEKLRQGIKKYFSLLYYDCLSAGSKGQREGIETGKIDPEDVVIQSIYVPKQLSKKKGK